MPLRISPEALRDQLNLVEEIWWCEPIETVAMLFDASTP
jgi:hypothetical protein